MKIKHFFFMFFLCLLLIISTRAIQTSKDGNQFGVTKESKTKIGIDGWRDWGGSFPNVEKENNGRGDKEGGQSKNAKEKGEVHESVTEGWRDWGGAFPHVEKENVGRINNEGEHGNFPKENGEDNKNESLNQLIK